MRFFASLLPLVASRPTVFFHETFDNASWESRWVQSDRPGINGPTAAFQRSAGEWFVNESEQLGLRTATAYRHHASSARFERPFSNRGRDLVLQFTVKHEKSDEDLAFCAGGYLKILGSEFNQSEFGAQTPYKIMFGPDICGYDVSVIQLVFNWKGQNLHRNPEIALEFDDRDSKSHVYSLLLKPDNTYKVYMDLQEKSSGSLHEFWDFPNITIDDPTDQKPPNWIEKRRIVDPEVKKPETWVDEQLVPDPFAAKPLEWDDEEDGQYVAPLVENPLYKGPWFPARLDNPEFRGEWRPRQRGNPDYEEEVYAYGDLGAVGFDNILICDSWSFAKAEAVRLQELFAKEPEARRKWKDAEGLEKVDEADSKIGKWNFDL